jgi:serralysin
MLPLTSLARPTDSINTGVAMPTSIFDVFFAPAGYTETLSYITSEGWNAYEQQQFNSVFRSIEDVANVRFFTTNTAAQAEYVVVLDTNEAAAYGDVLGYFYLPNGVSTPLSGVFNGGAWDRSAGGMLEQGGDGYQTILHELLHGLGLGHPHDTGGGTRIMNGVSSDFGDYGDYDLNQGVYTAMTYNTGHETGDSGDWNLNWGYEATPMALDIAVLQDLYGANTTHAGGNDTYTLPGSNVSGTHWESIWDTGGTDLIRFTGAGDATVDLRDATLEYEIGGGGYISSVEGVAGGFTIANGVVIENVQTGRGDDNIMGNDARNIIKTGAGDDIVYGGAGRDKIKGNGGRDELWGEEGRDKLVGGGGVDYLLGGAGNDVLKGGRGGDTFFFDSAGGNDKIKDFGRGNDTLMIDLAFWGSATSAQQLINLYADDSGADVIFDFGGGNTLTFEDVADAQSLVNDIFSY